MPSHEVDRAVDAIRGWGERCDWTGWDPYDALNSPYAAVLSCGRPLGRRLLTQAVKTSPLNLRPLLRIPKERDAKGIALVVSGYARLAAARDDRSAEAAAETLVDWLLGAAIRGSRGIGWGYHFDVQTRFFHYARGQPNAIATVFAANALLDVRELLGDSRVDKPLLETAAFLEHGLLAPGPHPWFRYVDEELDLIHNANLLACALLVRIARTLDEPRLAQVARQPLRTSLEVQARDGSWPYSERPGCGWIDNFHTGYILEALATCRELGPDVPQRLVAGLAFWERELFLADGTPRDTSTATLPLDAHSYAQAIETWLAVAPWNADAHARAERTARLLVTRMLAPDGHVYFEQRRLWMIRVPFVRWTTAAAFRALAGLLLARSRDASPQEATGARLG